LLFARLSKEPWQFAPPVVAEMTIPQALICFKETDPKEIKKQSQREADDAEFFKGRETIEFDTTAEAMQYQARRQKEKQDGRL